MSITASILRTTQSAQVSKYLEIRGSTVNVRGILGKEPELVQETVRFRLNIVGISETKKKVPGKCVVSDVYHMNYSGVKKGHAPAGVAIAYDKTMADRLIKWEPVNERILWAIFRPDNIDLKVVMVYGPTEGSCREVIDRFFEELDRVIKTTQREKVIILGDLNSRVGNDNRGMENIMDKFGEDGKPNCNGRRLIDLCTGNDLIITNAIFRH
ncbi:hypothetical protein JGG62_24210, partial [Salmonella enterica subsp. enterica serovar Typhimurium]|nr:hypothetical protein [Salmonella enterica subsp. enterica serovar Typhimurium]